MSDLLIAVDESLSDFAFDKDLTVRSLVRRWPDARVRDGTSIPETTIQATIRLPAAAGARQPEIEVFADGRAISIAAAPRSVAAEVMAVICADQPVPGDGHVMVIHWADLVVPLFAGITVEQLLARAEL